MSSSVKQKTIHSLKWSTLEKLGQFSVQLIISIVLARILDPDEYALIGILNIFITISTVLVDAGFSQGLIRKLICSQDDYNSVFWFNLFTSLLLYVVLFFLMPFISHIFNDENLIQSGRVLMLVIPIQALNVVQITIVNRELQFKKIAKYTLFIAPVSGGVSVFMAYCGFGVWSLIAQTLLYSVLLVLIFWIKSEWRPSLRIKIEPIKELFGFSFKLSLSSLLNTVFNNIFPFVIAKLYSKNQFGYFSQAQRYATMPTNLIESILNRMTYPILATLRNNVGQYKEAYKKMQTIMFAGILPVMIGLLICGKEVIILILGEKWEPSVLFFQILCVAGISLPFHPLAMSNLKVFGRSDLIFKLELVKKVLIIVALFLSLPWGIVGMVCGQTIYMWVVLLINLYYGGRQISYCLSEQLKDVYPYFIIVFFAFIVALASTWVLDNLIIVLCLKLTVFLLVYFVNVLLLKLPQFAYLQSIIKQKIYSE